MQANSRLTRLVAIGVLLTLGAPLLAKTRIKAPTAAMTSGENISAVVKAVAPDEERGAYRFSLVKALHGEPGSVLVVRMEPATMQTVEQGRRYVLGYTKLLPVPDRRNTFAPDPLGPRIIILDDAGPALVDNTKPIRQLILAASPEEKEDPERSLRLVLEQLGEEPPAARRFVAAELHMGAGLSELLTPEAGATLDHAWRRAAGDPQTRYHLLSVAEDEVGILGTDRLARYSREVLDAHGARLELTSYDPLLVLTAARALGPVGSVEDLPRLEKHLYSNNTGVPKAVLPSMDTIDPEATAEAARLALTDEDLNPETRRVLDRYLLQAVKQRGD